jgi:hypothetical protein
MGIWSGSGRFRRYEVLGELPQGFQDAYEEAIQKNAFADFSPQDQREQVMGWVGVDDWFDSNLPRSRWLIGNTVNLTLRIDTKRIPPRFFQHECRKLEAEWKLKSGEDDLTRAGRDEIAAIVRRRLLERVIPACQGVDVSWDLERGAALCWNTADRVNETFRTLFERTFRLRLRPLFPYYLAQRLVGGELGELLDRVVPVSFRPEGGG